MYEKHILEAVENIRRIKKVNLHVRLPEEELPDGRFTFQCDCEANDTNKTWFSFNVVIEKTDLSPDPQQIDKEAGITHPRELGNLIMLRIGFRIWRAYAELNKIYTIKPASTSGASNNTQKCSNKEFWEAYCDGFFKGW